jgi:hypothetical protein
MAFFIFHNYFLCANKVQHFLCILNYIYTVSDPLVWVTINDSKQCEKIFFRPSLEEIYDLQWSPDSNFILAGAINSKAEIVRVLTKEKESLIIAGHTG